VSEENKRAWGKNLEVQEKTTGVYENASCSPEN
jgi:hypothetical protein